MVDIYINRFQRQSWRQYTCILEKKSYQSTKRPTDNNNENGYSYVVELVLLLVAEKQTRELKSF